MEESSGAAFANSHNTAPAACNNVDIIEFSELTLSENDDKFSWLTIPSRLPIVSEKKSS